MGCGDGRQRARRGASWSLERPERDSFGGGRGGADDRSEVRLAASNYGLMMRGHTGQGCVLFFCFCFCLCRLGGDDSGRRRLTKGKKKKKVGAKKKGSTAGELGQVERMKPGKAAPAGSEGLSTDIRT